MAITQPQLCTQTHLTTRPPTYAETDQNPLEPGLNMPTWEFGQHDLVESAQGQNEHQAAFHNMNHLHCYNQQHPHC